MQVNQTQTYVDLNETLALRIIRSCPKALQGSGLEERHCADICRFKKKLQMSSRRQIELYSQNYPSISGDERCLINAMAAAQSGHQDIVRQFLNWLLPHWAVDQFEEDLGNIAAIFKEIDIDLTLKFTTPPARREVAGLYAVIGSNRLFDGVA
ncbi:hypothetical protein RYZ26_07845 [Terasakiella sp. A23]|uniref:hypothetical protein n=1 Tax=Terasakiella sp. FCG-A23 TaxID=3080561 RepID=UPI00295493AB|nr:hypothetical protein [Terasakiella sp. A23]MDV7339499.1 hypothetical protein [Terasakiella sp. A23]